MDAVLWDMDGLMVDSEPLWTRAEAELAAQPRRHVGRRGQGAHRGHAARRRRPDDPERTSASRPTPSASHDGGLAAAPHGRAVRADDTAAAAGRAAAARGTRRRAGADGAGVVVVPRARRRRPRRRRRALRRDRWPATRSSAASPRPTRTCSPPQRLGVDVTRCVVLEDSPGRRRERRGGRLRRRRRAERRRGALTPAPPAARRPDARRRDPGRPARAGLTRAVWETGRGRRTDLTTEHPVIERYTLPEMGRVWSEAHKYELWCSVEVMVLEAHAEAGTVPADSVEPVRRAPAADAGGGRRDRGGHPARRHRVPVGLGRPDRAARGRGLRALRHDEQRPARHGARAAARRGHRPAAGQVRRARRRAARPRPGAPRQRAGSAARTASTPSRRPGGTGSPTSPSRWRAAATGCGGPARPSPSPRSAARSAPTATSTRPWSSASPSGSG